MFSENKRQFTTHGIGLGLSTVKTLSEALLGGVSIKSVESECTECAFSIFTQFDEEKILRDEFLKNLILIKEDLSRFKDKSRSFSDMRSEIN